METADKGRSPSLGFRTRANNSLLTFSNVANEEKFNEISGSESCREFLDQLLVLRSYVVL
jgi:hypothetical protein